MIVSIKSLMKQWLVFIKNKEYNKDFRKDDKLFVAIGLHLEPALERLSNVQTIKNPLKDEIIRRHQEEFNYSKVLNKIIKQETNLSFDDDEILCFQPQKDTTLPYVKEFNSQLVLICRYLQEKY